MFSRPFSSFISCFIFLFILAGGCMGWRARDPRFEDLVFASGLYRPMDLEFSADDRMFVTEQPGKVKVFPNLDAAEPILAASLSGKIFPFLDTGMLGLAVHPSFLDAERIHVGVRVAYVAWTQQ